MTFGEKLQKLRKEAGLSQEELAWQLGVSRQAVSKWERDGGYPETEKIIRMSRIFHVTLDYLLNEETSQNEEAAKNEEAKNEEAVQDGEAAQKEPLDEQAWRNEEPRKEDALSNEKEQQNREAAGKEGIHVSRETAEGFLAYQKRKSRKIAVAAGLMAGSLSLSFLPSDGADVFFMLILIVGIVLLFSVRLADNPYRKLWREPLLLDEAVRAELDAVYAEKRKGLQTGSLIGIALIALGFLFFPLLVPAEFELADTAVLAAGMLAAGIGVFLCVYGGGLLRAYRLLVMNEGYWEKRKSGGE